MTHSTAYPVRVEASLDPRLSRWLWLVKWLLAVPHYLVLALLWVAFALLSVGAFVAILLTGRYPRAVFAFNVGVLRWSWRVAYYAYGALGTDRYPPFTLAEVPDYPAHLEVAYPEHLSRGLVLVKWWLLAIPHYIVVAFFVGGGTWAAWRFGSDSADWGGGGGGLIGVLVLVAAVVLAVTGRYPQPIFDFVLGMNRWVLRVAAYAGLMTDAYPPFRLDLGGHERDGTLSLSKEGGPGTVPPAPPAPDGRGWTTGRIVSVVAGAVLVPLSLGVVGSGSALLWADHTHRDGGFLTSRATTLGTDGYALASERIDLRDTGPAWGRSLLGDVRIRVTGTDPARAVFVGVAPADAAAGYLSGVRYATVRDFADRPATFTAPAGRAPASAPTAVPIWTAQASGQGTQTLVWPWREGRWTVVAMNADGSAGVSLRADAGATVPSLPWIEAGLLAGGAVLLVGSVLLIVVPVRRVAA